MSLADDLIKTGWLKTPEIIAAFRKIKREDFLPKDMKNSAGLNEALPIGSGQTISQSLTVAFMLEKLNPKPGQKVLDIGSGSGWTSALLAEIVGEEGKVTALEIVPELKNFGEKNASKYNFIRKKILKFVLADGSKGFKKEAPYDRILVSASARKLPPALKKQLKANGIIVIPIRNSIWVLEKKSENEFVETEYPGFAFVPLV
mgnify:CR=1 FL=1